MTVDDDTGEIDVTIVIEEGPRTIVALVEPPDLAGLSTGTVDRQVKENDPLRPAALDADTAAIATVLAPRRLRLRQGGGGRPAARVSVIDDYATVSWTITRGERRTIGGVVVQGNVETRDEIIERQVPF